ncbi:MAG: NAD-dependent malic enzyme [Acidobacteriota bacterium]
MQLGKDLVTLRVRLANVPGTLGTLATEVSRAGSIVQSIDIIEASSEYIIRDITISLDGDEHLEKVLEFARKLAPAVEILRVIDRILELHEGGKIEVSLKREVQNARDLARVYTPGVAKVCRAIHQTPEKYHDYTIIPNSVAVITDGSAVLGLGNIGPRAGMPVMEGKVMIFKRFAGIDAVPILLGTQDPREMIEAIVAIAPTFGGINLEDISAPRCFRVERELRQRLDMPVFHDDQHGTAVVALAGLINSLRVADKSFERISVVISGAGAAGNSIARILHAIGVPEIVLCDSRGAISPSRTNLDEEKQQLLAFTNPKGLAGSLEEMLKGRDVFIGVSGPNLITPEMVRSMARDPIVFAMANPDPEILPHEVAGIACVMATGRSDFPNQINNALCFPGIFRGALDARARTINDEMKIAAAHAIANLIPDDQRHEEYIIPSAFHPNLTTAVAAAVAEAAVQSGAAPPRPAR